jgi:hypothetical protein
MGKYTASTSDIFSLFESSAWLSTNIKTIPSDFIPKGIGDEFIRVNTLFDQGINNKSCSGLMIVDIFVPSGKGPKRTLEIADLLDEYFSCKTVSTVTDKVTQFFHSSLANGRPDTANPTLWRTTYNLTFKYYGAN